MDGKLITCHGYILHKIIKNVKIRFLNLKKDFKCLKLMILRKLLG